MPSLRWIYGVEHLRALATMATAWSYRVSSSPSDPSPIPAPTEAATAVALVRAEAAELATIGAQAARLGLSIDVAEAVQKGIRPDALRASILNQLAVVGAVDGSAVAVVVLLNPADATAADATGVILARGPAIVSKVALVFDATVNTAPLIATKWADLTAVGIVPRTSA